MQKPKLLPPVYAFLAIAAMLGLHWLFPVTTIIRPPFNYLGALLLTLGLASTLWAARRFAKIGTPIKPFEPSTALVTGGLYRFTRNPMYLGLTVALIGVAVLLGTLSPFIPIAAFVWIIQRIFIEREEVFMEDLFGQEYRSYKTRVRRWL
jgi:protein-S-isoprenylcysteine O-methyltransferase Ste14